MVFKTVTSAGVSKGTCQPFNSMEINDQINGHQGTVIGDKADAGSKIVKNKINLRAGILTRPLDRTFSRAFAN